MSLEPKMHWWLPAFTLTLLCALACGCSSGGASYEEESNLRALAAYYSQYVAAHRGQMPPNEKAFKEYIAAERTARGSPAGDADVNKYFVSNRDGKAFGIRYRSDKSWPYGELVAYEQEGAGGTRHVATLMGGYEEMTEEQFQSKKVSSVAAK